MCGAMNAVRRLGIGLAVGALAFLPPQPGQGQPQPSIPPPDMPRNLISPLVPYEQGIANIEAQDAARPKAVQPNLPMGGTGLPNPPAGPVPNGPPAGTNVAPPQR